VHCLLTVFVESSEHHRDLFCGDAMSERWVRRTDGTDTDFSYIDAVKGQPKSNAQEFYDACRGAVAADLLAAKKRHFETHGDSHAPERATTVSGG
jgi:hypothetical protein